MTEPAPPSSLHRAFSFSKDIELSFSRRPSQSSGSHVSENVGKVEPVRVSETDLGNGFRDGEGQVAHSDYAVLEEMGSVHSLPDDLSASELNGSPGSSIPPAELSRMAQEQSGCDTYPDSRYDLHRPPTDFELFLAKSRAEFERDRERNWPTVEIDGESVVNKDVDVTHRKRRKVSVLVRNVSRLLQLFTRWVPRVTMTDFSAFVLILASVTVARVQDTEKATQANDEMLWPNPLLLWPECLAIATSALSTFLSLRTFLEIKLTKNSCCNWNPLY